MKAPTWMMGAGEWRGAGRTLWRQVAPRRAETIGLPGPGLTLAVRPYKELIAVFCMVGGVRSAEEPKNERPRG
jgi:hypothetical protein